MKRSFLSLLCTLSLVFQLCFSLTVSAKIHCRNTMSTRKIALTFDDGPHPRYTKEILEILREYQVTATFFVIGLNVDYYPDDLKKIAEAGCEIGNHTYSHSKISTLSKEEIQSEILRCEESVYKTVGIRPTVFRPPEGLTTKCLEAAIDELDYSIVLWSIDTKDWAMNPSSQITETVMKGLKGGDIILMHDYVSGGNTTCKALRSIIPQLLSQGYEFITVSELIS